MIWNLNEHDLLARLPRSLGNPSATNGTSNGTPVVARASVVTSWDESFQKLQEYGGYEDDWDGQGASAPTHELTESAWQLIKILRAKGITAPAWTVPGVGGTVAFEWLLEEGRSLEIEVTGPYSADVFLDFPDRPSQLLEIKNEVEAVS